MSYQSDTTQSNPILSYPILLCTVSYSIHITIIPLFLPIQNPKTPKHHIFSSLKMALSSSTITRTFF
ncbi:hypothetical protein L6452_31471 [Arctium lappa]|uniref:Uncharacterized protein n=1 Tax=Arctium lappa TaxID=4217 RepID=A0ACB8Z1Q8_ARCLA|nr:hypothetical protein L6452_31471 [Arctium lappa]